MGATADIGANGIAAEALRRILEGTHNLQTRVLCSALRRRINNLAVDELVRDCDGIRAAIDDLREAVNQ